MRTIKFRGKRIDNGEWCYGTPVRHWMMSGNCFWDIHEEGSPDGEGMEYTVTTETIGQFTGLFDKNGVEIYEGDILRTETDKALFVTWHEYIASFSIKKKEWTFSHFFGEAVESEHCEVIGNIHDNPEMI